MTQFGVHALHTVGFAFVRHGRMHSRRIDQRLVGGKQVAVVPHRLWTIVQQRLKGRFISLRTDRPAHHTTAAAFDEGYDIDSVFFFPMKLYNSSISVSYTHLRAHETDSYLVC